MEKINFTTLTQRIFAKTPVFWRKIRSIAIALGTSAVALLTANDQLSLELPLAIITVVKYTIAVCVTVAGTAQLTKEDVK